MTLLLIYLFVSLAASFFCSLLEASLLSVPRSHVAVMVERGSRADMQELAKKLLKARQHPER